MADVVDVEIKKDRARSSDPRSTCGRRSKVSGRR
jgi:hypothetical protein